MIYSNLEPDDLLAVERARRCASGELRRVDLEGGRVLYFYNARPSRTVEGRPTIRAWEDQDLWVRTVYLDEGSVDAAYKVFAEIYAAGRVPLVLDFSDGTVTVADPAGGYFMFDPVPLPRRIRWRREAIGSGWR